MSPKGTVNTVCQRPVPSQEDYQLLKVAGASWDQALVNAVHDCGHLWFKRPSFAHRGGRKERCSSPSQPLEATLAPTAVWDQRPSILLLPRRACVGGSGVVQTLPDTLYFQRQPPIASSGPRGHRTMWLLLQHSGPLGSKQILSCDFTSCLPQTRPLLVIC